MAFQLQSEPGINLTFGPPHLPITRTIRATDEPPFIGILAVFTEGEILVQKIKVKKSHLNL